MPLTLGVRRMQDHGVVDKRTDLRGTALNMVNCFVGAGVLTVPFAFRLAGYAAALGLALIAALVWGSSLVLGAAIEKASMLNPQIPYSAWDMGVLGGAAFGVVGEHVIRIFVALELWLALETFLVLTGLCAQVLFGVPSTPVIIISGTFGLLSLSLPMRTMSIVSLGGVWCMLGGLAALCLSLSVHRWEAIAEAPLQHVLVDQTGLLDAISIFLYCFSGLPCLPNIRSAMQRPGEYASALHYTFAFAFPFYMAIGLVGYHAFGTFTHRDLINDLAPPSRGNPHPLALHARLALAAAAFFAAKLQAGFPIYAAPVLKALSYGGNLRRSAIEILMARIAFTVASVGFAIFARYNLDAIAELMGAVLTNTTSIIFPAGAYAMVCRARGEKLGLWRTLGLGIMIGLGVVLAIAGTVSAVRSFHVSPGLLAVEAR